MATQALGERKEGDRNAAGWPNRRWVGRCCPWGLRTRGELRAATEEEGSMRGHRVTRLVLVTLTLGMLASGTLAASAAPNRQDEPLQIVFSVPGLNFPFFLHMMNIA